MINAIIFDWIGTLYERNRGLFPYSEKVLQYLRQKEELKYRIGLISIAKDVELREKEIWSSGIAYYLDSLIIDKQKTQNHYLQCMRELGSIPETTLIVGDRMIREIKIGNKLGCQTYWIKDGEYAHELPNGETGQPTKIINSVEDLLNIL